MENLIPELYVQSGCCTRAGWSLWDVLASVCCCRVVLPQMQGDVTTRVDSPDVGPAAARWLQHALRAGSGIQTSETEWERKSSMLPGQSTSCNNSVSPGHWQGSWVHGFLLMWLQGLFRSFPDHSLPAVVVQAHLCPVSLVGSAQLLVGPCDTWAEGSGMVWGALPDSPTNW